MVVNTSVVNQTIWCNFRATRLYMELLNNTMKLTLEHFEEDAEVNERLNTINEMIERAMKSLDKDEQTISFYQDLINDQISRMSWRIQSINDIVQNELLDIIYEFDASKYYRLKDIIRHFYYGLPDND